MKKCCPSCGKKFDYDYSLGICPHCGKYDRPVALQDDDTEQNASLSEYWSVYREPSVTKQKEYTAPRQKEHTAPKQKKYSIFSTVISSIIVAMIIATPIISTFLENEKIAKITREQKVEELEEIKEYASEPFTVTVGDVDVEVTIEDAKILEFGGVEAPEGWKYVEVSHRADSVAYFAGYEYIDVCLHWEGHYVQGLGEYNLSPEDDVIRDALYDSKDLSTGLYQGESQWVFLVPQEVGEATIEIYEKQDTTDKKYRKLNKVYLVDIKVED